MVSSMGQVYATLSGGVSRAVASKDSYLGRALLRCSGGNVCSSARVPA